MLTYLISDFQDFHQELLDKEAIVGALKEKAVELMRDREHVPGLKDVKKQLRKLGQ